MPCAGQRAAAGMINTAVVLTTMQAVAKYIL